MSCNNNLRISGLLLHIPYLYLKDMNIVYKYTKHQVARSTKPDAENHDKYYLIKNVSEIRATYQIRLLAYRAINEGKKLIIRVTNHTKIHPSLRDLQRECGKIIKIERFSNGAISYNF